MNYSRLLLEEIGSDCMGDIRGQAIRKNYLMELSRIALVAGVVVLLSGTVLGDSGEVSCAADEHICLDGECIYEKFWCDGDKDCSQGEDENSCEPRKCGLTEFQCSNGHCIQDILKCNGDDDCDDFSDENEINCDLKADLRCHEDQVLCDDKKKCIRAEWQCDQKADCMDGSDETDTVCEKKTCRSSEFACKSGHQCIPGRWKCDRQTDCADASDEADDCDEGTEEACDVTTGQFQCSDHSCISLDKVCDGKSHCPGEDDEGGQCETACHENPCDQMCHGTPNGAVCSCYHGYKLSEDQHTCEDIDECSDYNIQVCSQICVNFPSSYHCECKEGYTLKGDKHSCKALDTEVILLYSHAHEIRSINLKTSEVKSVITGRHNITDIAYDHAGMSGTVFWADQTDAAIYSIYVDESQKSHMIPVISEGLDKPQGLVVDWVSALLYITDSGRKEIIACHMDGNTCSVLVKLDSSDVPADIVIDPARGKLYWSNIGDSPYIANGSMDGLKYEKMKIKDLGKPTGLFLDDTTERLYWADLQLGHIASIGYDGLRLQYIGVNGHPFSVAVFEDKLIWSDLQTSSIFAVNKFSGKGLQRIARTIQQIQQLQLIHPALHQSVASPCKVGNTCSHSMCLLSDFGNELSHSCGCPVGFHLGQDMASCHDSFSEPFLLVSSGEDIIKVNLNQIGRNIEQVFRIPLKEAVAVDFDPVRKAAIYSDVSRGVIGAMNLYTATRPSEELLLSDLGVVNDLAVDWVARNLFWIDSKKRSIEVRHLDGGYQATVKENLEGIPTAVIVEPASGSLFYAIKGDNPAIVRCEMTGEGCHTLVTNIGEVQGMVLDDDRDEIFWTDTEKGHIATANIDGSEQKILISDLERPVALAVFKDVILWTSSDSNRVHKFSLVDHHPMRDLIAGHSSMLDVSLVNWRKFSSVTNACSSKKGDCSHLCLAIGANNRKCVCPVGFTLQDEKECMENGGDTSSPVSCKSDETLCDDSMCVQNTQICDGDENCHDGTDEKDCPVTTKAPLTHKTPEPTIAEPLVMQTTAQPVTQKITQSVIQTTTLPVMLTITDTLPVICGPRKFQCFRNGEADCILKSWRCDHHDDCDDGSDEMDCVYPCSTYEFTCTSSSECVPNLSLCNGKEDCEDGSDEINCPDVSTEESCEERGSFGCPTGECIHLSSVCDGEEDCEDGEDEKDCEVAVGEDVCRDSGCGQLCSPSPHSPVCHCIEGYQLLPDKLSCEDVNECDHVPSVCSQECQNTEGSFYCHCAEGYVLDSDLKTCRAEARPYLLLGLHHEISNLTESGDSEVKVLSQLSGYITSVDIDQVTGDLFWTNSLGSVKKWIQKSGLVTSPDITFARGTGIAYDWYTGNVYITEARQIAVCSREIDWCKIILKLEDNPRGIALSPAKGLMFWTKGGSDHGLMNCWMTGEKCTSILTSSITQPLGVTVDHVQERLYLVDGIRNTIESCDFMGKLRMSIRKVGQPFSLDIFEDWLYFTDFRKKSVMKRNKDGSGEVEVVHTGAAKALRVVHPFTQIKGNNACDGMQCSHLCLLTPSGGECMCPVGFGFVASSITECTSCVSYCMNGGSCAIKDGKLLCSCVSGVNGDRCEEVINPPSATEKPVKLIPTLLEQPTPKPTIIPTSKPRTTTKPITRTKPNTVLKNKPEYKENGSKATHDVEAPIVDISSVIDRLNTTLNVTHKSAAVEESNSGPVVAGVITVLLIMVAVLIALVVLWKRGKKPQLSKLVWYHKGSAGHKKKGEHEELVPESGILNPAFEEQDINFNTEKSKVLRYPSDTSIDSAFISTSNTMSQYSDITGSTCRLIPHETA